MSLELQMLVWTAILCVLQAFPYTLALIATVGPIRAMSYPQPGVDTLPEWALRSKRSHANTVENLAPFAVAVLVVQVTGISNEMTVLGAQIFFGARVAMVIGHTAAIPLLRSLAWFTSLGGLILILLQLL